MHNHIRLKLLKSFQIGNESIAKTAGDLATTVESYLSTMGDMGIVNMVSPTIIGKLVNKLIGGTFIGLGIDLFLRMIGVDFEHILSEVCGGIKNLITSKGNSVTPSDLSNTVSRIVNSNLGTSPSEEHPEIISRGSVYFHKEVRAIKIASAHIHSSLYKKADASKQVLESAKPKVGSFLSKLFTGIFSVCFKSAGMQLFADVASYKLDLPSPFSRIVTHKSSQTKWKSNPAFVNEVKSGNYFHVYRPKTEQSIKSYLVDLANEVYQITDQQALISSKKLNDFVDDIISDKANLYISGNHFYIPKEFNTLKDIVDYFIDDAAAHAK